MVVDLDLLYLSLSLDLNLGHSGQYFKYPIIYPNQTIVLNNCHGLFYEELI